jgi:HEAT repeat protein
MTEPIDALIALIAGEDYQARLAAAEALGRDGSEKALAALLGAMQPYTFMRSNSEEQNIFYFTTALILAEHGRFGKLGYVACEDAPFVRPRVIELFERVGRDRAIHAAIAMLFSASTSDRYWAAEILAAFRDARCSAVLVEAIQRETDVEVQRSMRHALSRCGITDAI